MFKVVAICLSDRCWFCAVAAFMCCQLSTAKLLLQFILIVAKFFTEAAAAAWHVNLLRLLGSVESNGLDSDCDCNCDSDSAQKLT